MSAKGLIILQDAFLNHLRKEQIQVTVHLTNGFQLRGLIKGFDNFVIMLDVDKKQMMLYKHAVSTISPARYANILTEANDDLL